MKLAAIALFSLTFISAANAQSGIIVGGSTFVNLECTTFNSKNDIKYGLIIKTHPVNPEYNIEQGILTKKDSYPGASSTDFEMNLVAQDKDSAFFSYNEFDVVLNKIDYTAKITSGNSLHSICSEYR